MKSITDNLNLSLLEIFAVLLPGGAAILLGWQLPAFREHIWALIPDPANEWHWSLAFLGGAYFIGHILFYMGSFWDDFLYDKVKFLLHKPKEEELEGTGKESLKLWARILYQATRSKQEQQAPIEDLIKGRTHLFKAALQIKKEENGLEGREIINLYKWAIAKFLAQYPALHAEVERHQAASKFFRSMAVVGLLAAIIFITQLQWTLGGISVLGLFLSLLIYLNQRFKAVKTAYEYVVVVAHLKKEEKKD